MHTNEIIKNVVLAIETVEREFRITREEVTIINRIKDEINRRVIEKCITSKS